MRRAVTARKEVNTGTVCPQLPRSLAASRSNCLLVTGGHALHSTAAGNLGGSPECILCLPVCMCAPVCAHIYSCVHVYVCACTKEVPFSLFFFQEKWTPPFLLISHQNLLFLLMSVLKTVNKAFELWVGIWERDDILSIWPSERI